MSPELSPECELRSHCCKLIMLALLDRTASGCHVLQPFPEELHTVLVLFLQQNLSISKDDMQSQFHQRDIPMCTCLAFPPLQLHSQRTNVSMSHQESVNASSFVYISCPSNPEEPGPYSPSHDSHTSCLHCRHGTLLNRAMLKASS